MNFPTKPRLVKQGTAVATTTVAPLPKPSTTTYRTLVANWQAERAQEQATATGRSAFERLFKGGQV